MPRNREFMMEILGCLAAQAGPVFGPDLLRVVEENRGRRVAIGIFYSNLYTLEARGLVVTCDGEIPPEPGNRRHRYYRIEQAGRHMLQTGRHPNSAAISELA